MTDQSLTEFDHAWLAAGGEELVDPVQNAWLDSTCFWEVWLGITGDDTIDQGPGPVVPTWQLLLSCEADMALLKLGEEMEERVLQQICRGFIGDEDYFYDYSILETSGRMLYDRSQFVEPKSRYGVSCE